jgi:hypothetical protein
MAHLAPSLVRLRTEVNATWPTRSKASDGWIGDAAHAARASDHNPDNSGRVHAIDVTVAGIDKARLIARAIADPRTAYVISDRRIWENPAAYPGRGYWRAYTGTNPHVAHVHISSRRGSWADSTASWGVSTAATVGGPIIILPPVLPGDPGPITPTPTPDPITPTPTPEDPLMALTDSEARELLSFVRAVNAAGGIGRIVRDQVRTVLTLGGGNLNAPDVVATIALAASRAQVARDEIKLHRQASGE